MNRSPRSSRLGSSRLLAVVFALLFVPAFDSAGADPEVSIPVVSIPVVDGKTSLSLWPETLGLIDVEWDVVGFHSNLPPHRTSVAPADAPAFPFSGGSLTAVFADGPSPRWRGAIRHQGGLVLRRGDVTVNLVDFQVAQGPEPRLLLVLDAAGFPAFEVRWLHAVAEGGAELRTRNGDLVITEELAERLGVPEAAGRAVGLFESLFRLASEPYFPSSDRNSTSTKGGVPGCSDWTGSKDVALIDIGFVQQVTGVVNGEMIVAGSATLKNVGTGNVPWYTKFSGSFPPYGNDQHPFLVWSMYREVDGIFRQMGVSSIKHAYLTINDNCDPGACTNSHILGLGCEDVYGVGTNISNSTLAPREEVDPWTGIWTHCDEPEPNMPSHFDPDGDCIAEHNGGGDNLFTHGMRIRDEEIGVPGASYFFESWYVIRDDINIYNTMGRVQLNPSGSSGSWNFNPGGLIQGPAIESWVALGAGTPNEMNQRVTMSDGQLQIAVKVTDVGGGMFRYAYALQNHDFTRGVDRFLVGLPEVSAVQNLQFFDNDADPDNDWRGLGSGSLVQFNAPGEGTNDLSWGEMFAFVFETNVAPESGVALSGDPAKDSMIRLRTLTPGSATIQFEVFNDGFETGDLTAWSGSFP